MSAASPNELAARIICELSTTFATNSLDEEAMLDFVADRLTGNRAVDEVVLTYVQLRGITKRASRE